MDSRVLGFAARHFGKAIRPATPADLAAMAHIHATSGTPGLLTELGEAFLRDVFYAGLLKSRFGQARVIDVSGRVAGFSTYSPDSARLFRDIFRPRLGRTLLALARASVRRPRVALHFAQTVLVVDRHGAGADIPAEAVSLEVAPEFQGLGLGFLLLQAGVTDLQSQGVSRIKARILECNREVERLYPPLGFHRGGSFRMHGRDWALMVLDTPGT
jgi:ribosomal protein S18 acetylase RimI-like enzyme